MKPFTDIIEEASNVDILQYHIDELENMATSFYTRFNEIKNQEIQNEYFQGEARKYYTQYVFISNYVRKLKERIKQLNKLENDAN